MSDVLHVLPYVVSIIQYAMVQHRQSVLVAHNSSSILLAPRLLPP